MLPAVASILESLLADAENYVEGDLPSAQDVRKVLAAVANRLSKLEEAVGVHVSATIEPAPILESAPAPTEPAPEPEPAPVAEEPTPEPAPDTPAEPAPDAPDKQAEIDALKAKLAELEASP